MHLWNLKLLNKFRPLHFSSLKEVDKFIGEVFWYVWFPQNFFDLGNCIISLFLLVFSGCQNLFEILSVDLSAFFSFTHHELPQVFLRMSSDLSDWSGPYETRDWNPLGSIQSQSLKESIMLLSWPPSKLSRNINIRILSWHYYFWLHKLIIIKYRIWYQ